MGLIENYRDLEIWQSGMDVARRVYGWTATFSKEELCGLVSQMRRAAVSIPSSIAEGFARRGRKEMRQFLTIALGSIAELETQFILARDLSFLQTTDHDEALELLDHLGRMITKFSQRL